MKEIQELIGDYDFFVNKCIKALSDDGIDVSSLELDHLCYRTKSLDEYEKMKKELVNYSVLLHEPIVSGRPIAVYKLHKPLLVREREISLIETPAPKAGKVFDSGLEHVEFVLNESFNDFMSKYPNVGFGIESQYRESNPEIKVFYDGFEVKFHHQHLEKVVEKELEKNKNVL